MALARRFLQYLISLLDPEPSVCFVLVEQKDEKCWYLTTRMTITAKPKTSRKGGTAKRDQPQIHTKQ